MSHIQSQIQRVSDQISAFGATLEPDGPACSAPGGVEVRAPKTTANAVYGLLLGAGWRYVGGNEYGSGGPDGWSAAEWTPPAERVVVTRHPALLEYLVEQGLALPSDRVITHATQDDVRDRHVIGVLPHHLSSLAASVTEIQVDVPAELRGVELTIEQLRQYARGARRYQVREVPLGGR